MAAPHSCCSSTDSPQQKSSSSTATLARAVDLFVMTKFEKCLQVCCNVIESSKYEPEQERNNEVIEAAAALGIQALAEMDQWHHTVSFIIEVYGAIHLCTARIIQVCILLHAHVEEYLPCHKLVQTWLTHPDNVTSKQCAQVIRVYSEHILLPLGQFGVLEEIVRSCPGLSKEESLALLELPQVRQTGRYKDAKDLAHEKGVIPTQLLFNSENEESETRVIETPGLIKEDLFSRKNNSTSTSEGPKTHASSHNDPFNLFTICKKLYCSFYGYMKVRWREKFILLAMAAFALWAAVQTQSGDSVSSLQRLVILWQGFFHRLNLMLRNS
ncbi:hypothetical protein EGW08_021582 [Elysia chlorotica]|uniref:Uncharacterized protein n=1 Tax=Elysia chlorotica TaxID=188477 RepID=A0A3S0Z6T6_ELYCH|nr:hypothetical protein EGW08_021582 [Elysia chlorotica]